jgi:hypothetical protein
MSYYSVVFANTAANIIDAVKERIESRGELGAVTLGFKIRGMAAITDASESPVHVNDAVSRLRLLMSRYCISIFTRQEEKRGREQGAPCRPLGSSSSQTDGATSNLDPAADTFSILDHTINGPEPNSTSHHRR